MRRVIMKTNITIAAALLLAPSLALADETIPEKRPANIVVHVSNEDAILRSHTTNGLEIACHAPCDQAVPADLEYRLSTHGASSAPFTLQRDARKVAVESTGPSIGRSAGLALTVLGGLATVAGLSVFAYGAVDHQVWGVKGSVSEAGIFIVPTGTNVGPYHDVMISGGIAAGVGLVALVSGLVLFATSKRPQVVQTALTF